MAIRFIFKISAGVLFWDDGTAAYSVGGTSGRGSYMNKPQYTHVKDQGPIPIGGYTMKAVDLSDPSYADDVLRSTTGDWGDWRITLTPLPKTDTMGRSGFFIHCGSTPGSAGCIDIGGGLSGDTDTELVKSAILGSSGGVAELEVIA